MLLKKTIRLQVGHPILEPGLIAGFRFIWAFYVSGFRPEFHCQPCFRGKRVDEFCTGTARSGLTYEFQEMDRYKYLYICGVGSGPKRLRAERNFHLPIEYAEGGVIKRTTYNGYVMPVENAVELPIPALPQDWQGRDRETTRCKNLQFGVAYFGCPGRQCR
jgi:hypothetical protein